jgi:hypothetical protein
VSAERLVPIEGGTPGGMNRHFDKHTGRMAQIGLIQQVKLRETWPTPHGFSPDGRTNGPSGNELGRAVNQSLWPTPTVCGNYNRKGASANSGDGLATAVKAFPTPKARDWKDTGTVPPSRVADPGKDTLGQHVARTEPGGSLNPTWVEWLMGWPLGWTDCALSATDRFRQWLRSHGSF